MLPYVSILGYEIQTYSLAAILGFTLTAFLTVALGKRRCISSDRVVAVMLLAAIGAFIGGHFLFGLTNLKAIIEALNNGEVYFSKLLKYVNGAVFYGGLFGAAVTVMLYTRRSSKSEKSDIFDLCAVGVPFFHIFGRIGCFLAGCCYGVESSVGITTYSNLSPIHYGICRFPVQLAEALANALIFSVLLILYNKEKFKGRLFLPYLSMYAPVRFCLEFFRADEIRGFFLGLSTSQIISLLIIVILAVCYVKKLLKSSKV